MSKFRIELRNDWGCIAQIEVDSRDEIISAVADLLMEPHAIRHRDRIVFLEPDFSEDE